MSIEALHIKGLRTLADVRLDLVQPGQAGGLTVLIGENGSGKSTIIEACEILSRIPGGHFLDELHSIHGGLAALLRQGAREIELGIAGAFGYWTTTQPDEDPAEQRVPFEYRLVLGEQGGFAVIREESLRCGETVVLDRREGRMAAVVRYTSAEDPSVREGLRSGPFDHQQPLLTQLTQWVADYHLPRAGVKHVLQGLKGISVHLPFEVMPAWAARALDRKSALRGSALVAPAQKLDKLGLNLANAYHALKNAQGQERWQQTLDYIRLGLGQHIEEVNTWADPGGGQIGLSLKLRGLDRQVLAAQLSDGMLSYLAFVALYQLARSGAASLLAFDEPDLHLHPQLLQRVLDMLESLAADRPVLLATHSDRLLDALQAPANSVVLCELDEHLATRLWRPDAAALQRWLERYRGIGDLRGEGYESAVMNRPVGPA